MTAKATVAIHAAAAPAEIAGCVALRARRRRGASALRPASGVVSRAAFGRALTLAPRDFAGRADTAYAGVRIAASPAWLRVIEGQRADARALTGAILRQPGAILRLPGAGVSLLAPRVS